MLNYQGVGFLYGKHIIGSWIAKEREYMDLLTFLTIIGIGLTAGFGIWGVFVVFRSRYPGQITLVRENMIALFDAIVKHFPEISVNYKSSAVSEGLVLLRAALLNTGSKDITPEMVAEKVSITLPENFQWLNAKITSKSPDVHGFIKVDQHTLYFDLGLFRRKEFIRFEALVEVPLQQKGGKSPEDTLGNIIKVSHRIADTQKVISTDMPSLAFVKKAFLKYIFAPVLALLIITLIIVLLVNYFYGWPAEMQYELSSDNGQITTVRAKPKTNGRIRIKGEDIRKTIDIEEFAVRARISRDLVSKSEEKAIVTLFVINIILPILLYLFIIWERRKERMLRNLLSIDTPNTDKENSTTQQTYSGNDLKDAHDVSR